MDFVTLEMPCPVCGRGPSPGVLRNAATGQPQKCPNCGGAATVPIPCQRQPFDYSFPDTLEAASGPGLVLTELQLDDDSYFELDAWVISGPTGQPFTVQVSDLSSGWQFSNIPLSQGDGTGADSLSTFAGTAASPAPLLVPYFFRPSAVVQSSIDVPSTAVSIQLTMKGYKLYPLVDPDTLAPTGGIQGAKSA